MLRENDGNRHNGYKSDIKKRRSPHNITKEKMKGNRERNSVSHVLYRLALSESTRIEFL